MGYAPSEEILEKYAKVLVNFALDSGKGIKPGQVVYVQAFLSALPLYRSVKKAIVDSGGTVISSLGDDMSGAERYFYENASENQLSTFLDKYARGLVDQVDHRIAILSDYDLHELDGVEPKKIMLRQKASKPLMEWFDAKESAGKYTWTLALYATPAQAKEAGLSLRKYWDQIIEAAYLDFKDPIAQWRKISKEISRVSEKLSNLEIEQLYVKGSDVDLKITVGKDRKWLGGSGRNIPSFEVFTSPDWRGTEGWIRFNQPWYRYGSVVRGIELRFKNGRVVQASARENQKLLLNMLKTDKGASQLGEFSLTDKRLSRITRFMAHTLFDENIGGRYGNTHIAVGKSYIDTYRGDAGKLSKSQAASLGFNDSAVHNDMISTTDRTVTARLPGGKKRVIYRSGRFII